MPVPHPSLVQLAREDRLHCRFEATLPVVASAIEHRLGPLLDDAIKSQRLGGDRDALVLLAMHSLAVEAETDAARRALVVVLDAAESIGVDVAVFKGLAIGTRWYRSAELRPASDVDIVVSPADVGRLAELVSGFDPQLADVIGRVAPAERGFDHAFMVDGVAIDVHSDPTKLLLRPLLQQAAWEQTEFIRISESRSARVFSTELTMIHTVINLLRDNFADLLHLFDLRRMLESEPDWDVVERHIEAEGWTDLVRFGLSVGCQMLDRPSPLPPPSAPTSRVLARAIWPPSNLLRGDESMARGLRRQALAGLLVSGRRRELLKPIAQRLFPPRSLIDHQSGCERCPYPVALYRWRRAQRWSESGTERWLPSLGDSPSSSSAADPDALSGSTREAI